MKKRTRKSYSNEYKQAVAARAAIEGAGQVAKAEKLGADMVRRWARQFGPQTAAQGVQHRRATDCSPDTLRERVAHLEAVNRTLAKAVAELAAE